MGLAHLISYTKMGLKKFRDECHVRHIKEGRRKFVDYGFNYFCFRGREIFMLTIFTLHHLLWGLS
jgi:hypothetical protein